MKIKLFQIDAFTSELFRGNPAAVCPLNEWLDKKTMQSIAAENNLSETAFFVKNENGYHIRWFTPTVEVDLCGHATLASAYVIFNYMEQKCEKIVFNTMSGELIVTQSNGLITLDFPSRRPVKIEAGVEHKGLINFDPEEIYFNTKTLFLLDDEQKVRKAIPNLSEIEKLDSDGLIITAKGSNVDFVSRYFAPHAGIAEDPVTGAAHTVLTPLWAQKLGKNKMIGHQVSKRGGELICEDNGERVKLSGYAKLYLEGEIFLS